MRSAKRQAKSAKAPKHWDDNQGVISYYQLNAVLWR